MEAHGTPDNVFTGTGSPIVRHSGTRENTGTNGLVSTTTTTTTTTTTMNALGSGMEWRMMSKQARACGVKGPKVAPRAGGRTRSLRHPPSSLSSWTKTSARCPVVPRAVAGKSSEPVSGRSVGDSGDDFAEVGQICAVLGTQWGDEGKGKLVDAMAQTFGVVARAQGGANAGHTIYSPDGTKHALHLMPCGILNPDAKCVIGNGCVIHIPTVLGEIEGLREKGVKCDGRLFVSDRAHVLLDLHKEVDGLRESELADKKIGTTKRGIGPCYSSKAIRNGIRVHDLLDFACFERKLRCLVAENEKRFGSAFEYDVEAELEAYRGHIEQIRPYISDSVEILHEERERGSRILIEGANATMLDLDFGTYPFVTSSSTTIGGVCSGLGMAPNAVSHVVGVAKAYTTRVGAGPYPTEIHDEVGDQVRSQPDDAS